MRYVSNRVSKMNKNLLVSIIIPIYNSEKFLHKCLDSVILQTYSNIEIILVNDGSTDMSPKICQSYVEQDSRITIIDEENNGLPMAVTKGVEFATGEYICFVDSDDYIAEDMIEKMLSVAKSHNADIVQCNYCRVYDDGNVPYYCFNQKKIFEKHEIVQATIQMLNFFEYISPQCSQYFSHSRWGKLIRTELIRLNIQHVDYRIHQGEDLHRILPVFLDSKTIVAIPEVYYYYVQHSGAATKRWSLTRPNDNKLLIEHAKEIATLKGVYQELSKAIAKKEYELGLNLIERTCAKDVPLSDDERIRLIVATYKSLKYVKIKYSDTHTKRKRYFMRILLKLHLYKQLLKKFNRRYTC